MTTEYVIEATTNYRGLKRVADMVLRLDSKEGLSPDGLGNIQDMILDALEYKP